MAGEELLSVNEALKAVLAEFSTLPAESVSLELTLGRVLARDIVAKDSLPPFASSSMDGYAVRAVDTIGASGVEAISLKVLGDIAAGTKSDLILQEGTTARIMTGAPLPNGADAVVPVEDTSEPWRDSTRELPSQVMIRRTVQPGDYIRLAGEDVAAGILVLDAGHLIRPQEIGLLASLGVAEVPVVRRPKVGVLSTGDELISVEEPLRPGKIRNSNSYVQVAQISDLRAEPISLGVAKDSEQDVKRRLQIGLDEDVDMFISSAGVSVGAYDVVKSVLDKEGDVRFWRVRMRPGKPLAFGRYRGVPFLGLPGNPVSAMVSFERFARPAILRMAGHSNLERPTIQVRILDSFESDGRETYLRVVVGRDSKGYWAKPTGQQGSHMITSLVKANALVVVPEGVKGVAAGDQLKAFMLDWPASVF